MFKERNDLVVKNIVPKRQFKERNNLMFAGFFNLTHSFPMHLFSTPWKYQKTERFSGDKEMVHWVSILTKKIFEIQLPKYNFRCSIHFKSKEVGTTNYDLQSAC